MDSSVTQSSVYAGAALGALRLILECIEEITQSFPKYEALEKICRGRLTSRLLVHLGRVYQDLFEFFNSAASLFTASSGRVKRPIELIATVIWRPFDERFGGILSNMMKHEEQLNDEVNIYQLEQTRDIVNNTEEISNHMQATRDNVSDLEEKMRHHMREQTIKDLQTWLNAPNFANTYWNTIDECQEDTAQWIFDIHKFREWSMSVSALPSGSVAPDSKVLWIHGNPGGGKSVLAASIIRELSGYNQNLVYFFFREQYPFHTASDLALRAILAQILHKHKHKDDILDKFSFAKRHGDKSSGQPVATLAELKDLLHLCLAFIDSPVLILDGIDECTQPDEFVKYLRTLLFIPTLRALFSSRPTVQALTKLVPPEQRLSFGQVGVENDIYTFCRYHLIELIDEGLLLDTCDVNQLTRRLVVGADRMFLWAKLMLSFLQSPALNRRARESLIYSITLPEGLGSMYMRIFRQISFLDSAQRQMAKKVIQWTLLCHADCFLSWKGWYQLLGAEDPDNSQSPFARLSELISLVTCGLVILRGSRLRLGMLDAPSSCGSNSANCVFLHLSVREYLWVWKAEERDLTMLCPPPIISHMDMARVCLDHLVSSAPPSIPLRTQIHETSDGGSIDLHAYCSVRWLYHLGKAVSTEFSISNAFHQEMCSTVVRELCDLLRSFLENPLVVAHWIEYFYTSPSVFPFWSFATVMLDDHKWTPTILKDFSQTLDWLRWAEALPLPDVSKKVFLALNTHLLELIEDLTQLSGKWNTQLSETPSVIWSDALAFTESKYLPVAQSTYQVQISSETPESITGASRRLCHISATSSDGSVLGILSVWPSRKFEEFWGNIKPNTAYTEVEDYCEDWYVTYELSRVSEKMKKLGTVSIPLQATEVALQLRQAFRQEHLATWKASFPLSISFNGYSICVLRTVYQVTIEPTSSKLLIRSCRMPLEEIRGIQKFWEYGLKIHDPNYALSIGLPPTLQLLQRQVYKYRTIFDASSHYIFFQDAKKFEAPLLAVFKIECSQNEHLEVRLVAVAPEESRNFWLGSTGVSLATARFHPESKLIVSATKGHVMAWDFSRNIMNHLSRDGADVTSLSISACANYVVVMRQKCDSHEVYDLRECELKLPNKADNTVNLPGLPKPTEQRTVHDTHEEYLARLNSAMEVVTARGSTSVLAGVAGNTTIVNGGPQDIGCQLRIDGGRIKLTAPPSVEEATSKSLDLLSIPNTIAGHDSRITLYLPRQHENHFSFLVDKGIEDGYDMLDSSGESLPVLVRKDKRLIDDAIHKAVGNRGEAIKLVGGTKRMFSEIEE
ncbi:heterokaryon incompatibility protein het-E-1 [Fusarium denticulatum]|uniref:Heterokaryon incompatibility protein het-E-1 n=1 Tax=Fusarium denticulatum TaxID=48507 RepID=A0A8H5XJS6_9HYPO|nr:heterokaryon incompatibility protein het-E-1 [Fusarium denticulatum]